MNNIKNVVFYTDPFLGDYTIQDLIYYLENLYIRNKKLDNKITDILTKNGMKIHEINKLLGIAETAYDLKFIIDMLNDNL